MLPRVLTLVCIVLLCMFHDMLLSMPHHKVATKKNTYSTCYGTQRVSATKNVLHLLPTVLNVPQRPSHYVLDDLLYVPFSVACCTQCDPYEVL